MSVADASKKIRDSRRETEEGRWIDWGIFLKEDLNLIGWVGVGRGGEGGGPLKTGYWVGDVFQQQRYGTEAVTAIVSRAPTMFGTSEMEAFVLPTNIASISLLKRLGFTEKEREMCGCPARGSSEEFARYLLDLEKMEVSPSSSA